MFKTIGILGGMGPEAGCEFFRRIIQLTPASGDQDHLPVILYSLPQVPDRTAYLMGRGESPIPALVSATQKLERWGADLVAIPCNTAHHFWKEIQAAVRVPVLHIVEVTCQEVSRSLGGSANPSVGLLGTRSTVQGGLYSSFLTPLGIETINPSREVLEEIHSTIWQIKGGRNLDLAALTIQNAIEELESQGAGAVIFGCTELGLVRNRLDSPLPIYDSVDLLAQRTVELALKEAAQAAPVYF